MVNGRSGSNGNFSASQSAQQPSEQKSTSSASSDLDIDPQTLAVLHKKYYRLEKKLNQGAFGKVYKAVYEKNGQLVAIKMIDMGKMSQMFRAKYIPRELQALIETQHNNVIKIFDVIRSNNQLFIAMEFCSNGDIAGFVRKNGPTKENLARYWFKQVIEALMYFHREHRMAHRDIKLDNVLLDDNFDAKLTDFGFAKNCWSEKRHCVELSDTICGTEPYMSPQLIKRIPYNAFLADSWAMGIMLFAMLNGRFPFTWNDQKLMLLEQTNHPKFIKSSFVSKISDNAIELVTKMLDPSEKTRMTIHETSRDAWMSGPVSPPRPPSRTNNNVSRTSRHSTSLNPSFTAGQSRGSSSRGPSSSAAPSRGSSSQNPTSGNATSRHSSRRAPSRGSLTRGTHTATASSSQGSLSKGFTATGGSSSNGGSSFTTGGSSSGSSSFTSGGSSSSGSSFTSGGSSSGGGSSSACSSTSSSSASSSSSSSSCSSSSSSSFGI